MSPPVGLIPLASDDGAMPPHRIDGERLGLRAMRASDAAGGYHRWMHDPEVLRFTESRAGPYGVDSLTAYITEKTADGRHLFLAIIVRATGAHIGNVKVGPVDRYHRLADLGIIIGEKDHWGRGFATEAIALTTAHCFDRLGLHKITAGCYAVNRGAVRAFEKAGFEIEGWRRNHCLYDGAYVDLIQLGRVNPAHDGARR